MPKTSKLKLTSLALCLVASPSWAQTSNDISSAYFGIGFESVNYSEKVTIGGQTVETDSWTTNLIQRSGSYVAVGDKKGFYINTSSSLLANDTTEDWNYGNVGAIQQNQLTAEHQAVDLLGTYRFTPKQGFMLGARYQKLSFSRYDFKTTSNTPTWLDVTPDTVVSETATSFSLAVGYEYDEFFNDTSAGMKWNGQFVASIPFYSTVTNTSAPGLSFTDSFSGYDLNAHLAVGWYISKRVIIAARIDSNYSNRNTVTEGLSVLPDNNTITLQSAISAHWSF